MSDVMVNAERQKKLVASSETPEASLASKFDPVIPELFHLRKANSAQLVTHFKRMFLSTFHSHSGSQLTVSLHIDSNRLNLTKLSINDFHK
jgi:hypothetical protein